MPGLLGSKGELGEPGHAGLRYKGIKGDRGLPGHPGPNGFKGESGDSGLDGRPGLSGPAGSRGLPGNPGEFGFQGLPGNKGKKGDAGDRVHPNDVLPGMRGDAGFEGFNGLRGDQGFPGQQGFDGRPGKIGIDGDMGPQGPSGSLGYPGEKGLPGLPGRAGSRGPQGSHGIRGEDAPRPPPPKSRGFFFARHSQHEFIPVCPRGTIKMWDGFSLLNIMGNSKSHGQDLGAPGSCMKRFNVMPYMFCNLNDVCDYAQRNDYSYWLSTTEPMPMTMTPIPAPDVGRYISRCSVCEAPTRAIAVHSQSMEIPKCPGGWEELWNGYSYIMVNNCSTLLRINHICFVPCIAH